MKITIDRHWKPTSGPIVPTSSLAAIWRLNRAGQWATVTNFRGGDSGGALSRGELPTNFLTDPSLSAAEYFQQVRPKGKRYRGFNLLVGSARELAYCNNLNDRFELLEPGVYTLSNDVLDTPWPKAELARQRLERAIEGDTLRCEALMAVLSSRKAFPDGRLPDTGVGLEMERTLSPPFIVSHSYGTRCTSVLLIDHQGRVEFAEQSYLRGKAVGGLRQYRFTSVADKN